MAEHVLNQGNRLHIQPLRELGQDASWLRQLDATAIDRLGIFWS